MSDYRLLVAQEVIVFLDSLKKVERLRLMRRFEEIAAFPGNYADYEERDPTGRRIDVNVFGKFAIAFWGDFAGRDLKIISVKIADR